MNILGYRPLYLDRVWSFFRRLAFFFLLFMTCLIGVAELYFYLLFTDSHRLFAVACYAKCVAVKNGIIKVDKIVRKITRSPECKFKVFDFFPNLYILAWIWPLGSKYVVSYKGKYCVYNKWDLLLLKLFLSYRNFGLGPK